MIHTNLAICTQDWFDGFMNFCSKVRQGERSMQESDKRVIINREGATFFKLITQHVSLTDLGGVSPYKLIQNLFR